MNDAVKKLRQDLEIEWLGLDGFLIALYLAIVGLIFYALKTENDFIVGTLIPYSVMAAVTVIFLTYVRHVLAFMGNHRQKNGKGL
ncbi:hypothetical protein KAR29_12105 [Aminithiophilus ramosus]|uniref:Uncharacterized protein n=2 Tax=Synergistales TaxID=649776 RepID=A0A9Q7A6Y6_9BACT|nr:hypothetical protein [Aminithiophilus ramosus]QTX32040.1 hypothetical protein KAR29_12105 [Aminithiophilus ramosus]QVL35880.1 hypothetical protein KIH16_12160 [Synergistota bacterium]